MQKHVGLCNKEDMTEDTIENGVLRLGTEDNGCGTAADGYGFHHQDSKILTAPAFQLTNTDSMTDAAIYAVYARMTLRNGRKECGNVMTNAAISTKDTMTTMMMTTTKYI